MNSIVKQFVALAAFASFSVAAAPVTGTSGLNAPSLPGTPSVVDFESQGAASFASLTLGGVTFSGIGGSLRSSTDFSGSYNSRGQIHLDNNEGNTLGIRFDFGSVVSAFAFNWGASDIPQWTLSGYDAANNLIASFNPTNPWSSNLGEYIGLSGGSFKYATLTVGSYDYILLDNFTYVTERNGNQVSEPAGLALAGLALLGLGAVRRRKA